MPLDDMLDDGEAKPGAARVAAARRIDTIESLGQAGEVGGGDAIALVGHAQDRARTFAGTSTRMCGDLGLQP